MKIIIAIVAAAIAVSANAGQPVEGKPSIAVRYDDINLGTARGQAMLDRRILAAAQNLCGAVAGPAELALSIEADHCVRTTVANAKTNLAAARAPVLAAR